MDFHQRRLKKWINGRRERGLPLDAPFQGDELSEIRDECLDLVNYAEQAMNAGRIPEQVGEKIMEQAYGIDLVIGAYADS